MAADPDSPERRIPFRNAGTPAEQLLLERLTVGFGLLSAAIAVIGLLTAHSGIALIGGANPDNKTIALSAALIWIFLGSVLAYQAAKPFSRIAGRIVQAILVMIAVIEAIEFMFSIQGNHFFIETAFVSAGATIFGPASTPISPVASGLAVFAAVALVFVIEPPGTSTKRSWIPDAVSISGIAIILISITFVLSYAYGSPLLYGTQYIPIAAMSALAALFTGSALITAAGPGAVPARYMTGNSTSASLLRVFIPLVTGIVLLENFAFAILSSWFKVHGIIILSASLVIFAVATALVVAGISGSMGSALEQAEQQLVRKNEDLGAMNEELTATQEELRQTNDELVAHEHHLVRKNDELNALNEELTATQEELRQTNDELVAHEHHLVRKNDELNALNEELTATQEEMRQNFDELMRAEKTLRESEERYRLVADFTHDWEFWADPDGRIQYISPSTSRILGRQFSLGSPLEDLYRTVVHPDDLDDRLAHMAREVAGEGPFEMEYRIVRPDGEVRWIHHVCQPVFDSNGGFLGTRGSNRDTTGRRKAEEELKRKNEELNNTYQEIASKEEELHRKLEELTQQEKDLSTALAEKEILLSEIHHRVKNNLTAFISLLSLEGSTEETPAGKLLKQDLQNRARSMALIHETLYKTHLYNEVDMGVYLTNLLDQIAQSFKTTRSVKTVIDAHGVMLDIPRATPAGLIINEIVTNSFKYAFPESFDVQAVRGSPPTITIALKKNDGGYVMTVSDNGIGLPSGFDITTTQTLGLKLVNFLAKHQLRANAEVRTAEGTEFVFRFKE